MRPRPALFLVAALCAATIALFTTPVGALRAYVERPRPQTFALHEWGVWVIERNEQTLEDLARELPRFVENVRPTSGRRTEAAPAPWPRQPPMARKPVVFARSNETIDLQYDVTFRDGSPWFTYPRASVVTGRPGGEGLSFRGRIVPRTRSGAAVPRVARNHFWSRLRTSGGFARFETPIDGNTTQAEEFLFYDGPARLDPLTSAVRDGDVVELHARGYGAIFLVEKGRFVMRANAGTPVQISPAEFARDGRPLRELRAALEQAFSTSGLDPEALSALLDVWKPELEARARHGVVVIPQTVYESALPVRVSPAPTTHVRVGLAIVRF